MNLFNIKLVIADYYIVKMTYTVKNFSSSLSLKISFKECKVAFIIR